MEMSELTAYALEKYGIQEEHKWADFPGYSVLVHPQTGKWVALLMRQWDAESGSEIECCDLKCGELSLTEHSRPWLSSPIRMRGQKWVGLRFDGRTEPALVFRLLDRAVSAGEQRGYTIVLGNTPASTGAVYRDTPLPFAGSTYRPAKEALPERLRKMRRLYEYGRESLEAKANNFYRQGIFMQDYEDDAPWKGDFLCYYPTYHDLTAEQLRGYFSWRARVRRGDYQPIAASAAYLYLYELLNGIGASSPEDSLRKLRDFETGYLDAGIGDQRMRQNLRRWMREFAILQGMPAELVQTFADPEQLQKDRALALLRDPEHVPDEELFPALCLFGGKKFAQSPVLAGDAVRGRHLFCEVWRKAAAQYRWQDKDLFTLCFGVRTARQWYPLANAVYYQKSSPKDAEYVLDETRVYRCRGGSWQVEAYEKAQFDRERFQGLLHQADVLLRRYLKTGRGMKEREADAWADPYIRAVMEEDRRAAIEAARPKIEIDLSGLDQIRRDALQTRDSLLTEDDLAELTEYERTEESGEAEEAEDAALPAAEEEVRPDLPLSALQIRVLRALLRGESAAELLRANYLMPSIAADAINEALFDEIGDTVLACEDDRLSLVEDYREDLEQLLGGSAE
ncbi:MAG: TerB N-terminal domain-containing protein [Oscillospiraceae bacterium]|nr:TerB N-terminal domain-containing protein [Oscillospiraceae bacterium]